MLRHLILTMDTRALQVPRFDRKCRRTAVVRPLPTSHPRLSARPLHPSFPLLPLSWFADAPPPLSLRPFLSPPS